MTGPREVQWRRFCETMAPQRDELERRAALCPGIVAARLRLDDENGW